MIKARIFFILILVLIFRIDSIAQQITARYAELPCHIKEQSNFSANSIVFKRGNSNSIIALVVPKDTLVNPKNKNVYPPASKDFKKLALNTSLYFGATIIAFGVLALFPENVSGWQPQNLSSEQMFDKWDYNVHKGPVMDHDNNFFNYATHPYCGGVYYITARSCGFNALESFTYTALMSTFFWEYGIEAFAEPPSVQDLIVTPIIGSAVGEGFFYTKQAIMNNDKRVLRSKFLGAVSLLVLDPFNTVIDGLGYHRKVKTEMQITPEPVKMHTNKAGWGLKFTASF